MIGWLGDPRAIRDHFKSRGWLVPLYNTTYTVAFKSHEQLHGTVAMINSIFSVY